MASNTKSAQTLEVLATEAAATYADAVTNNTGKGGAAVRAFDALNRAISDGLKKGDAAETLAVYFQHALTARGSKEKCGANKVTQLALSADMALSHGVRRSDVAVIGAVYLARVGKVEGGADRIARALTESKGKPAADIVATVEALPRAASEKKVPTLTVEAVQKYMDAVAAQEWSTTDRATLAGMLTTAAESFTDAPADAE